LVKLGAWGSVPPGALTEFSSAFDTNLLLVFLNLVLSISILILPIADRSFAARGHRRVLRLLLFLLVGTLAAFALKIPAEADDSRSLTLIIPPNDGYGFEECLKGSQCGLVVADAWCKAHGFAGSSGFGPADDGTLDESSRSTIEPGSFHVTCGDHVN
jgi:hypothetical protein